LPSPEQLFSWSRQPYKFRFRLVDASLRIWIALHADRLTRAFARARVRLSTLSTHRQTAHVADASIALDRLQTLQVQTEFAAQVTFDHILAVLDRVNDLRKLRFRQVFGADGRVNVRALENLHRVDRADAVNVAQRNINALVRRDFYTNDACHNELTLTLFVTFIRADDAQHATATHHFAVLAQLLY